MHGGEQGHTPVGPGPATAPEAAPPEALPRLFLASRSPRRRELLSMHNIRHEAEHPGFDDSHLSPGKTSPRHWVTSLANLKALAGFELLEARGRAQEFDYVLGADTTCIRAGRVLGTPADAADALRIIALLSGGQHDVITGVALINTRTRRRTLFADRARVHVGTIPRDEIDRYIGSGRWQGKAGAYNLHERIDAGWPITFEGDATTITGLPMGMLLRVLRRLDQPGAGPSPERVNRQAC